MTFFTSDNDEVLKVEIKIAKALDNNFTNFTNKTKIEINNFQCKISEII